MLLIARVRLLLIARVLALALACAAIGATPAFADDDGGSESSDGDDGGDDDGGDDDRGDDGDDGGDGGDDEGGDGGGRDGGERSGGWRALSQDEARAAVARGDLVPLTRILRTVASARPGQVVSVDLLGHRDGMRIYDIVVVTRGNDFYRVLVDARRNRILETRRR